ncbi:hypothetical protein CKK34_5211 [Yarrowia sp. E02]|nr:hypothetical protein CKK34_5211 [Yarrowia sp. E02]
MCPDGDLKSWSDCAVVFAKRLSSKKWVPTKLVSFPTVNKIAPVRKIHVRELEWGQKLPSDFRGLDVQTSYCMDSSETRELVKLDDDMYFDLKAFQPAPVFRERFDQNVRIEGGEMIITYKGLEITLCAETVVDAELIEDITIGKYSVIVRHEEYDDLGSCHYVFPIHNLHYKNAVFFHHGDCRLYEIGSVVVCELDEDEFALYYYDVDRQQYVKFGKSHFSSKPVASYNGLIWWQEKNEDREDLLVAVAPLFWDLEKGQTYTRVDKSIFIEAFVGNGCSALTKERFSQCSREKQFLVAPYEQGIVLLDLKTGSVTDLRNLFLDGKDDDEDFREDRSFLYLDGKDDDEDFREDRSFVFLGFVGNTFYARCWPLATVFHCAEKMQNWVEGGEIEVLPKQDKYLEYSLTTCHKRMKENEMRV